MGAAKYLWLLGKLIALAFIFCGGGVLAFALILLAPLLPGDRQKRVLHAIHHIFRGYLWMLQHLGMLTLILEGQDVLRQSRGKIVIANHPSLLDVVLLMAIIPDCQCIVKFQLWNHWFLGRLMRSAGFIRNDLDPERLVDVCQAALTQGRSLIIFPEGTRSVPGCPVHFHRGFANIATLTGAPVQTVLIRCTPPILYKGEPLCRVPPSRPALRVSAGICLDENFYARHAPRSIASRRVMEYLEDYYRGNISNG